MEPNERGFHGLTDFITIFTCSIDDIFVRDSYTYAKTSATKINEELRVKLHELELMGQYINRLTSDNHLLNTTVRDKDCVKLEDLEEGVELAMIAFEKEGAREEGQIYFHGEGSRLLLYKQYRHGAHFQG